MRILILMRKLLIAICLLPAFACAQKYALIDKHLRMPIIYTDSVTVEQVSKGWFPVENKSIDTLIANIKYLKEILSERQRAKMKSFDLHSSNLLINTSRVPYAYGDRYNSVAHSDCGQVKAELTIINSEKKNANNSVWLGKLLAYFKQNSSFWKDPNEINPRLYNVVVITD